MMLYVFWFCAGLLAYTYVGFPLLVLLRARLWPKGYAADDITPHVSIIVAAHNEASCIAKKVENLLALDYPADKFEIVVASDGSDDGTVEAVRPFEHRGVRILDLPRCGKAHALNAAVASAQGSVLVFTDANSMLEPVALRAIVRPLADPLVGGVAGDQRYLGKVSDDGSHGERNYWNWDRILKRAESRAGNVISATGALYAIRRDLFGSVPAGVTDDFATSTRVIEQGYRLVFCDNARAWEPAARQQRLEFGRKVRVISRGLRGVALRRQLLNPFRHGFYSLQLVSHKVLRRVMVVPLLLLFVSGVLLSIEPRPFYRIVTGAQLALYMLAALDLLATLIGLRKHKLLALAGYFCMVNVASLVAVCHIVGGRRTVLWEPQRVEGAHVVVQR